MEKKGERMIEAEDKRELVEKSELEARIRKVILQWIISKTDTLRTIFRCGQRNKSRSQSNQQKAPTWHLMMNDVDFAS